MGRLGIEPPLLLIRRTGRRRDRLVDVAKREIFALVELVDQPFNLCDLLIVGGLRQRFLRPSLPRNPIVLPGILELLQQRSFVRGERLTEIPVSRKKRWVILKWLVKDSEPDSQLFGGRGQHYLEAASRGLRDAPPRDDWLPDARARSWHLPPPPRLRVAARRPDTVAT